MGIRDYLLLKRIRENPGISLDTLIKSMGHSVESRIKKLENGCFIRHTKRTYSELETVFDMVGVGNNLFEITDTGLVALENKQDYALKKTLIFIAGFLLGILSAFIISKIT